MVVRIHPPDYIRRKNDKLFRPRRSTCTRCAPHPTTNSVNECPLVILDISNIKFNWHVECRKVPFMGLDLSWGARNSLDSVWYIN